ncbi:D-glycerate dehydrogenase [Roseisolibacter sp. H3M3-2]|uniref:2-hydroxyacid dehydrogenase n=1 Tax=Roseisolibacter sp. H3M3-2 TaxID=3031323 RepID=UPI0023DA2754|nr:D-glycerate dehydrogenase [Roseisolibacter sp. H3M3-2]MDF1505411.1 D-glycerate dehydrogenase [Roseisolibacter sp. H3M3-2]
MAPIVSVTRRLPAEVEARLAAGYDLRLTAEDRPSDADSLVEALTTADAVLCTVTDRIDAAVLGEAARRGMRARMLANFGVGVNHIDLAAARGHGLAVSNTPGVLTDDTADVAMALILMAARRLGEGERFLRAGMWKGWKPSQLLGISLSGLTVGVVGFGRIGQALARRAHHGFGMRVRYLNPSAKDAEAAAVGAERCATLEELMATSDVVSLHCPATEGTRHLIDAAALAHARPGSILVNTARGDVVDAEAVAAALREGRLAAAGLDVFEREPEVPASLLALENVVLLPHLGSATTRTRRAMGDKAADNLDAFFTNRPLPDRVA